MSDLPPKNLDPHHIGRTRSRHRSWAKSAVLILGAMLIVAGAGWLAEQPPSAGPPPTVAVSLPSSSANGRMAASPPLLVSPPDSTGDPEVPPPETPTPVKVPGDAPPAQTAMLRRLNWDIGRFDGYVGINNHMGSRFTGDAQTMGWVMEELKARGLMFLESRTVATTIAAKAAAADGVPFATRDVYLDDEQTGPAVDQQLKELEAIAKKKGTAIAIGHPHDATIAALTNWIAGLSQKGIVLVPLTEVVKARLGLG